MIPATTIHGGPLRMVFVAMFAIYVVKNGVGLRIGLATAVANKGVPLALVAMAQTLPILTSGLDLSVGMIFVLTNCIASARTRAKSAPLLRANQSWIPFNGPSPQPSRPSRAD